MNPWAAIRAAFWAATAARQEFQARGGKPAAARSALIRACCGTAATGARRDGADPEEPPTLDRATPAPGAGGAGAGGGAGVGVASMTWCRGGWIGRTAALASSGRAGWASAICAPAIVIAKPARRR